tara:strand:+ start:865 stop:1278 length:414 start_codon:yes stop_codon:yes gene_type:complete
MSKLKLFVKEIEDFELASLYHYRFKSFMPYSKKIIINELYERNIKEDNIKKYLKTVNIELSVQINNLEICPRCLSNEFYNSKETENVTFQYETHEYEKDYKTCLVCLYSQDKIDHLEEKEKGNTNIFSFLRFLRRNR